MTRFRLGAFGAPILALVLLTMANTRDAFAESRPALSDDTQPPSPSRTATPHFVGSFDVLGIADGRYGAQIEWLPVPHLGVAAYGWWEDATAGGTQDFLEGDPDYTYSTATHAYGLDMQFRYYVRKTAGRGFFLAPGVEIQKFALETQQGCASSYSYDNPGAYGCPSFPSSDQNFTYFGLSFDIGAQMILPLRRAGAFVIAGSIGVQERSVIAGALDQSNMPWSWGITDGPDVRPRLRFSVGWAL
jgi:hypothetical protein